MGKSRKKPSYVKNFIFKQKVGDIIIVIILTAGTGTRLRPLTENIPKALLKINNVTILERLVKQFVDNNIDKFIFVVGHKQEKVREFSKKLSKKYGVKIENILNKKYASSNTSCSAFLGIKNIDEDFILVNGDNILDFQIISNIVNCNYSSMVIDNHKKLNHESFKIKIKNNIIEDIGKELKVNMSSGEFIGVSKVIKKDLNEFKKILLSLIKKNPQNYYDLAYEDLSKKTIIKFIFTNGLKWTEIDDHDDWMQGQRLVNEFENHG